MRILVPLMLALVVSVFLASCGGQEAPVEGTEEEAGVEESSTEETTTEETSDRAKSTVEETTASVAVGAREPTTPESVPESSEKDDTQEESMNASSGRTTWGEVQPEGISAIQTVAPDPATVGNPLTFAFEVTNNSFPQHVGFKDFLPQGMTFVSATPDQGFCGPPHHGGNLVDCTLGTIPNGGSVAVEIVVIPTAPGTATNLAQAGGGFAPVQSVSAMITVDPQPE
jgi:uncharacterized repeat protein (TIGR01451 family)